MKERDDDPIIEEVVDNQEEEVLENPETPEEVENPESIQDEDEEEDRIVSIGDEELSDEPEGEEVESEEPHENPNVVKNLRKVTRGYEKKIKALERQLKANQEPTAEVPVELGEKPTLKSCNYDDDKYEQELIAYSDRKKEVETQAVEKTKTIEKQNEKWKNRQDYYVTQRKQHGFKDATEIEELVDDTLSQTQRGIIIQGADDPALLVYALGKNPKKLEEFSKITDPVEFAFKVAKLETQVKVKGKSKDTPAPEKRVSKGKAGGLSGGSDKTLERLRDDAAKTGNYSKVREYKQKLRNKG